MFTKYFTFGVLLGAATLPVVAQTTGISGQYLEDFSFAGPPTNPIVDENGIPLDAGTVAAGDGDLIQFGYFASATPGDDVSAFGQAQWNSFTPLTSGGGRLVTTIGDAGGVEGNLGIFTISLSLDPALDPELAQLVLDTGGYPVRLGIKFFNDNSVGSSTHFNLVTSNEGGWTLGAPSTPPPTPPTFMNLDDPAATFTWQSGAGGEFQTSLLLTPEPSVAVLVLVGALAMGFRRRRHA